MHRTKALLLVFPILLGAAGCERRQHLVQQHLLEFGSIIEVTLIVTDLGRAERLLAAIETRLERHRRQWQAWEDSDATRFERRPEADAAAPVADGLDSLLQFGLDYHRVSGGRFNPAFGKPVAEADSAGGNGDDAAIDRIEPDPQLQLDPGGIARAYALALIADFLDRNGVDNYLVEAGGDLQIAGNRRGRPWRIGIPNPFAPGTLAALELSGRYSLFTSGNYRRQYRHGSRQRGADARSESSATVLARDPVRADVAATLLMIDGARKTAELALSLGVEDFFIVSASRELLVSRSFAEKLEFHVDWPLKFVN